MLECDEDDTWIMRWCYWQFWCVVVVLCVCSWCGWSESWWRAAWWELTVSSWLCWNRLQVRRSHMLYINISVIVTPHVLSDVVLLCVNIQAEIFPLKTCGWLRASWTSCWTRSTSHAQSVVESDWTIQRKCDAFLNVLTASINPEFILHYRKILVFFTVKVWGLLTQLEGVHCEAAGCCLS